MAGLKDVNWFKKCIAPDLVGYDITYRFFEEGDFGSLNQVGINSAKKAAEIDFWSEGILAIHIWDYVNNKDLLNVFCKPDEIEEQDEMLEKLKEVLLA